MGTDVDVRSTGLPRSRSIEKFAGRWARSWLSKRLVGQAARQDLANQIQRLGAKKVDVSAAIDEVAPNPRALERLLYGISAGRRLTLARRREIVLDLIEHVHRGAFRSLAGPHFLYSVAEQLVGTGNHAEALSLISRIPPPPPDKDGKTGPWPQEHHVRALVELQLDRPDLAGAHADQCTAVFESFYEVSDPAYLRELYALRDRAKRLQELQGAPPADLDTALGSLLCLEVRMTGHGPESRWVHDRLPGEEWFNEYQTAVAKVTARYLQDQVGKSELLQISLAEFEGRLCCSEGIKRGSSSLNRARSVVNGSLRRLVGEELVGFRTGQHGGIVFDPASLRSARIRQIRIHVAD